MNHNIPQYDFYKHKYGDELLIDVVPLNTIKKYLKEQPVHILTYYDITLITSGEGEFLIDHQANRVKPQDIIFTRPGEIRKWDDKTIQDGFALIFEEEFLLSFFNDPAFLRNLSYFHTERRSSKLSLDKKAYARISELISEIDKEIKNYQSKDKHLLRALLYETLMLLNRLYSNSNALPPDTNARSKSIYVDRFIELVNHSFKQDHSIRSYADRLCITPNYLNEIVKNATGSCSKEELMKRGFADCLPKPFSISELMEVSDKCALNVAQNENPDFTSLLSYGNESVMLEKLITETEKEMQAVKDAEQRKDHQELDALTHHLRSSWEILRADQPLRELYKLLHGSDVPDNEALHNAVTAVLDKGSEIIRLAKEERRKYDNER